MKKSLVFAFIFCIFSILLFSGCDDIPLDKMEQTTSIVGKIANINKNNTTFTVKAYLENKPDVKVSEGIADENGFFQVILPNAGLYVLKIDYAFKDTFVEYISPHNYNEGLISRVRVTEGKITNVNAIYTSLRDVYIAKVISYINSESKALFTVEIAKPDHIFIRSGFYFNSTNCTLEEREQFNNALRNLLSIEPLAPIPVPLNLNIPGYTDLTVYRAPTPDDIKYKYPDFRYMYNYLVDNYDTTVAVVLPKR